MKILLELDVTKRLLEFSDYKRNNAKDIRGIWKNSISYEGPQKSISRG
jgi:hypothetical protein